MKTNKPIREISTSRVFFKITLFGLFLLSIASMFLLMINNVLKALH
jgi:hypothetical protein